MSLPKYNELYIPLLTAIYDGKVYTMKEIKIKVSRALNLTEEELSERLPSGTQTVYDNRIGWAKTYLKKAGLVTKISGDDGIDGVIHEDKLGFNLIFIQAKRWAPNTTIGKPEIQKFAGAMMGPPKIEKGLFITTAKFSKGAREFADAQHIILVDGRKLTELMIEYNLGVSVQKIYSIKRIDLSLIHI